MRQQNQFSYISFIFWMRPAILLMLLALSVAFSIQREQANEGEQLPVENGQNSLTFPNSKGSLISEDQLVSLRSLAVTASTFYGPLMLNNLQYITSKMNSQYLQGFDFNLFMQTDTSLYSNFKITPVQEEAYASLGPGSNKAQPDWSYLLFISSEQLKETYYTFSMSLGKGKGFSNEEVEMIRNAIVETEGSSICYCNDSQFRRLVERIDSVANNVICQSGSPTPSYFKAYNDRWLVIKPRSCFYTVWANI